LGVGGVGGGGGGGRVEGVTARYKVFCTHLHDLTSRLELITG